MSDTISILDGNSFVVSNRQGDLDATPSDTHGFFLNDTRYLSRWVLTINGLRPTLLSVDDTAYYRVQHFLALATGATYIDSHLTVIRQRGVGHGFQERLVLINHGHEPIDLDIRIEVGADELSRALEPEIRDALVARLRALGYKYVTLDLRGYRLGSLNEGVRLQPA